jgi:hypothetical protein
LELIEWIEDMTTILRLFGAFFLAFVAAQLQLTQCAPQYPYPVNDPYYYDRTNYHQDQHHRREEPETGFRFEPETVMTGAKSAAKTTRAMADLLDSQGINFLSLFSEYGSPGKEVFWIVANWLERSERSEFLGFASKKMIKRTLVPQNTYLGWQKL